MPATRCIDASQIGLRLRLPRHGYHVISSCMYIKGDAPASILPISGYARLADSRFLKTCGSDTGSLFRPSQKGKRNAQRKNDSNAEKYLGKRMYSFL